MNRIVFVLLLVLFLNNGMAQSDFTNVIRNTDFLVFHQAVDRTDQSAIRLDNYELVKTWKNNQLELFDLSKDVSEKNDLAAQLLQMVAELYKNWIHF